MAPASATVIATAALLMALLASGPSVSATTGGAPVWAVGELWTYQGYYLDPGVREDFTLALRVVALTSTSTIVEANHTFRFGWMLQRTLFRWPSLDVVCSNQTFSSGQRSSLCYSPPLEWLNFTLHAGKSWNVSTSTGDLSVWGYRYTVLPETVVATPAGIASVFPVTQSAMGIPMIAVKNVLPGQGTARMYYSGDAGNIVFYEAFDQGGAKVAEASLTSPSFPSPPPVPIAPVVVAAIVIVAIAVVGATLFVTIRRRRLRPPPVPPAAP